MVKKFGKSLILVLVLTLATTGIVYADEEVSPNKQRFLGEITGVDPRNNTFSLRTNNAEDLRFITNERTRFRSRDGSIQGLEDLSPGMNALVSAVRDQDGALLALVVAAGEGGDFENIKRYKGTIAHVDVENNTFALSVGGGSIQRFAVGDRTRYLSRDGSISGLQDLEQGMVAHVAALEREDQIPMALVVAAGKPEQKPERFKVTGQITEVNPDASTFDLELNDGRIRSFKVVERTNFRSRDGSINNLRDLTVGMHAIVLGVEDSEGTAIALVVAAGNLEDSPGLRKLDVRAIGRITEIGSQSFTIETKEQGIQTFHVDETTKYRLQNGVAGSFSDLKIGMIAAVGGKSMDDGSVKAFLVIAREQQRDTNRLREEVPAEVVSPPR